MNLLKLNTLVISTVVFVGTAGVAQANSHSADNAVSAKPMAPLVKRSILLSVGSVNTSSSDISDNLVGNGYSNVQVTDVDDATTFAIGYRHPLGKHWSLDVTYIDQDDVTANVEAAPSGSETPSVDVAKSLPIYGSGLNYAGLRHFRVSSAVTAHAGAGAFIYTNDREATVDGVKSVEKDSGVSAMAQLGLSFAVTPRVSVELTGQRFFMPGEDVDRISLGLSVGF